MKIIFIYALTPFAVVTQNGIFQNL
uniref:Uncharacterized protein n=1 Tax=Anguilla anguilla TaxID=7936 RepID=A0A0E9PKV7_ANGAN